LKAVLSGPLPNAGNFFVVADYYLRNIHQVDATTGVTGRLLPFGVARYPMSLAYDATAKVVYWADYNGHIISTYSLLTNISSVIYRNPSNVGKSST